MERKICICISKIDYLLFTIIIVIVNVYHENYTCVTSIKDFNAYAYKSNAHVDYIVNLDLKKREELEQDIF